jgi:hypothetical protein
MAVYQGEVAFGAENEEREEHIGVAKPKDGKTNGTRLRCEANHDVEEEHRPAGAPFDAMSCVREEQPQEYAEVLLKSW